MPDKQRAKENGLDRYRRRLAKGFERSLHFRVVNVGIDHRCGQVGVTEHLLNQADLACLPVEFRSERVSQRVRRNGLLDPGLPCVPLNHPLHVAILQWLPFESVVKTY